jgi:hypothetical protein
MDVAALIAWIVTAGGGFVLLGTWVANGGFQQARSGESRFPPGVILGHFFLAAAGLVVWIAYLISDESAGLAWTAFVLLLPVALLGFVMLFRWLGGRRASTGTVAAAPGASTAGGPVAGRAAEQRFPVPVVVLHGLLAVTTLVLVLLAAIDAG